MAPRTPEAVHYQWVEAMNAGDLATVMAMYEPEVSTVAGPGQVVTGVDATRDALRGFLALQPRFELEVKQVIRAADVALLISPWTMTGTGPDGNAVTMSGTTTDVVREQADGTWRYIIDNPFGTA